MPVLYTLKTVSRFPKALIFLAFITQVNLAHSTSMRFLNFPLHAVVSAGWGRADSFSIGKSETFPIVDPNSDQFYNYSPLSVKKNVGTFNGFAGLEWSVGYPTDLQLGVGYHHFGTLNARGNLQQGIDVPSSDTYTYSYSVTSHQLLLEAKLMTLVAESFHPYLSGGVGKSSNQASSYQTSAPPFSVSTPTYDSNNKNSFSYSAGAGVDMNVSEHIRLGVGYRFSYLGRAELGRASIDGTNLPGRVSSKQIFVHELLMQLSLVI
jgi:opacity protein-like surface antigen